MKNKKVDEKAIRNKKIFIKMALEIVKENGTKEISARKVATKAGFSYATIYNYFKDMNQLLYYCIAEILEDCHEYVCDGIDFTDEKRIEKLIKRYIEYMIENQNYFTLVFLEDLGNVNIEDIDIDTVEKVKAPKVAQRIISEIENYCYERDVKKERVDFINDVSSNYLFGKITFYIKRNDFEKQDNIVEDIWGNIERIINTSK